MELSPPPSPALNTPPSSPPSSLLSSATKTPVTSPEAATTRDEKRPRLRWVGWVADSPDAEWIEEPDELIPRIHAALACVLPLDRMDMELDFMVEGTWNRVYTVQLHPRVSNTSISSSPFPMELDSNTTPYGLPSAATSSPSPSLSEDSMSSTVAGSAPSPTVDSPHAPKAMSAVLHQLLSQEPEEQTFSLDSMPTELIMRVALPVHPTSKTESEIATLQWVRENTRIPVPLVYAWDSTSNNSLGYEWILMERMSGQQYHMVEDEMGRDARITVAKTLADWMDSLSRLPFAEIGSLYPCPTPVTDRDEPRAITVGQLPTPPSSRKLSPQHPADMFTVGQCAVGERSANHTSTVLGPAIFQPFFGDWRVEYTFDRGPFATTHDFLLACAAVEKAEVSDPRQAQRAFIKHLEYCIEQDDLDEIVSNTYFTPRERVEAQQQIDSETEAEKCSRLARLQKYRADVENIKVSADAIHSTVSFDHTRYDYDQLPVHRSSMAVLDEIIDTVKPRAALPDPTFLVHWDISKHNVLVDPETGTPTALLDWEQIMTLPLSIAPYYPRLIMGDDCSDVGSIYSDDSCDDSAECQMRRAFDERLRELESPWLDIRGDWSDESDEDDEEEGEQEEEEEAQQEEGSDEDMSDAEEPMITATVREDELTAAGDAEHDIDRPPSPPDGDCMPSRKALRSVISELRHSFHNSERLEDLLQNVKDTVRIRR